MGRHDGRWSGFESQKIERVLSYHVRLVEANSGYNCICVVADMGDTQSSIVEALKRHVRSLEGASTRCVRRSCRVEIQAHDDAGCASYPRWRPQVGGCSAAVQALRAAHQ